MHVHPDIAALRSDRLAQRRIRAAMNSALACWRKGEISKALIAELARYGAGEPLQACHSLDRVMARRSAAMAMVGDWLGGMLEALRAEPLGEVPHLYRASQGLSSIQLLKQGHAALNLVAYEQLQDARQPQTVVFADRECVELVLAGGADGTMHSRTGTDGPVATRWASWTKGDRIDLAGPNAARQIVSVDGTLLLLQLTREPLHPGPSREFRLSDGALIQSASGDKAASQRVMALAVLGAMEHRPALRTMEARAMDRAEDLDVRWEAARQSLALDADAGMRLLAGLHRDESDPLAAAAGSLERQLVASHPELVLEKV